MAQGETAQRATTHRETAHRATAHRATAHRDGYDLQMEGRDGLYKMPYRERQRETAPRGTVVVPEKTSF
jgi:hypothetical protein